MPQSTPGTISAPASKTIPLAWPVDLGAEVISEITLRRPKIRQLRALEQAAREAGQLDEAVLMLIHLGGLREALVDEMDPEDFARVSEAMRDFFPAGQDTGAA